MMVNHKASKSRRAVVLPTPRSTNFTLRSSLPRNCMKRQRKWQKRSNSLTRTCATGWTESLRRLTSSSEKRSELSAKRTRPCTTDSIASCKPFSSDSTRSCPKMPRRKEDTWHPRTSWMTSQLKSSWTRTFVLSQLQVTTEAVMMMQKLKTASQAALCQDTMHLAWIWMRMRFIESIFGRSAKLSKNASRTGSFKNGSKRNVKSVDDVFECFQKQDTFFTLLKRNGLSFF